MYSFTKNLPAKVFAKQKYIPNCTLFSFDCTKLFTDLCKSCLSEVRKVQRPTTAEGMAQILSQLSNF